MSTTTYPTGDVARQRERVDLAHARLRAEIDRLIELVQQAADGRPVGPPLLYNVSQAARTLGLSKRTVDRLLADGDLPSVKIGARRLIRPDALQTYVDQLPSGSPPTQCN